LSPVWRGNEIAVTRTVTVIQPLTVAHKLGRIALHCTELAAARSHSMHPAAVDHLIESAVQSGYRANDDFPPEAAGGAPLRDHVSIVSRSPLS